MTRSVTRGVKALALAVALSAIAASTAGAATVLTPTSANFGDVKVGNNSAPQGFKLTVDCAGILCTASFNPTPSVTGDFTLLNGCPTTINIVIIGTQTPSCFMAVSFAPKAAGARTGTLSTGTGGPTAALSGTGVVDPVPTQATLGKCKKSGKKKKGASAAKKKCKRKKKK